MNIPIRFSEKLKNDLYLETKVNEAINRTESIIEAVKHMEFFPEYTKHDMTHIERVLVTSDNLIADDSFDTLSANDVATLILSVLFHDIGMFINDKGFQTLLSDYNGTVGFFDDLSWRDVWNNFFEEAKRFDGKKLNALFGEDYPGIEEPPKDSCLWNKYHKMLYGEFLRRHHSRLAHEIALYGFPGVDGKYVKIVDGIDSDIINLSGLIARSHGMNIRDTFTYLKEEYGEFGWRNYKDIKSIFLMAVLRIADYLHITSDRVPTLEKHIFKHSSHISKIEKELHDSISCIISNVEDSEAIYVHANPNSSKLYLRIEELLKNIQYELDTSWAIIGEVYGRISPNLKLTKRRIISNIIEDKKNFSKKVNYIPEKAIFDADPDLLKLLIKPLYGGNPSYGIRELLQNSIDACKECELLLKSELDYTPKVIIEIQKENDEYFFTITDNGVGMTKDILINYFLKAGSTYRNSQTWKNRFTDNNGKSMVRKVGKFGIGVLASFIIGKEIKVITKHIDSKISETLEFTASISDSQIEIKKVNNSTAFKDLKHGTIIKIKIEEDILQMLKKDIETEQNKEKKDLWFEWYRFDKPEVIIKVPTDWAPVSQKDNLISEETITHGIEWNTIHHEDFKMINWKYSKENLFLCNGFVIPEGYEVDKNKIPLLNYLPQISVYDYNGKLSLALNRKRLEERLPFEDELLEDICRDRIAKLLIEENLCSFSDSTIKIIEYNYNHPTISNIEGITDYSEILAETQKKEKLIFSQEGYFILHPYYFNINKPNKFYVFYLKSNKVSEIKFQSRNYPIIFYDITGSAIIQRRLDNMLANSCVESYSKKYFINSLLNKKVSSPVSDREVTSKNFQKKHTKNWICIWDGQSGLDFSDTDLCLLNDSVEYFIEYNVKYKEDREVANKDIFYNIADFYLCQSAIIPYSMEDRKNKFKYAFSELKKYMTKYGIENENYKKRYI